MIRRTVPQKTISKESSLSGVGLHTGENVKLTFKPAPSNTGIVVIRDDIDGGGEKGVGAEAAQGPDEKGD